MRAALLLTFALVNTALALPSHEFTRWGAKQGESCVGRCEEGMSSNVIGAPCECNASCTQFGDCCADYSDVCLSCKDRCGISYFPKNECQCNTECPEHGNCCDDFNELCGSGDFTTNPSTGGGDLSNQELKDLSERLIKLAANSGLAGKVVIDYQGSTSECSTSDQAPNPLFTTFDESIWEYPTIAPLKKMYDNYIPAVTGAEDNTPEEQAEENEFLDRVMESEIMIETFNTLVTAGVFTGTAEEFRAKLYTLWLEGYDRDGTSATVVGSSGFEHVFMGELKGGKVSGFHNWLKFFFEEQSGNIDYLGYLTQSAFGSDGQGITNVFKWNGDMKCIGSMFVGTPPELDLAMYTVCFLTRGGGKCTLSYNDQEFYITTYDLQQNGKIHIGTAYPDFT
eukprot:TCALIF_10547-PA protein Name:"Similar to endou Poly(U)-specific endoribonuclease (Paralichthys olivaceus)" AED:0.38 eAED:0.38 QI:102/0.83/0.85/1/1/1/7/69/394